MRPPPGASRPTARSGWKAPVRAAALALAVSLVTGPVAVKESRAAGAEPDSTTRHSAATESAVRATIERHLGRPYVWGASGIKSFDCSGFVWRVMCDNGMLIKRTTARKFYMCLPRVAEAERWNLGNVVFLSDLKHCGIVETPNTFYHAAVSVGTHRSRFDPLWRARICGVRAMPRIGRPVAAGE